MLKNFSPITFISAEKGLESKSEFSYRNYYEAKFIVSLLDYLTTLIYHKFNKGFDKKDDSDHSESDDPNNP